MSALALSVLLSFVSAVAYAGGAIVQERVATTGRSHSYAPLRSTGWWLAVVLNGMGGLLHVVALAYGPLSVVQPLGALTIVFALPMAALFVGRKAGSTAWRGAIMATVGLAGMLALTGSTDSHAMDGTEQLLVAVTTLGALAALTVAAQAVHRHPVMRSVLLAVASGISFGMASVFTKNATVDFTPGSVMHELPGLIMIAVLAVGGLLLSQASYRGAGLAAPLAVLTVVNPVVAAAVGLTLFGETFRYGLTGTMIALGFGVVAAGGLILLTTERIGQASAAPAGAPSETAEPAEEFPRDLASADLLVPDSVLVSDAVLVPDTVQVPDSPASLSADEVVRSVATASEDVTRPRRLPGIPGQPPPVVYDAQDPRHDDVVRRHRGPCERMIRS
ncbi:DMT family transporter [Streptomyces sp. TRM66268-LWL]|uniref:DMT family transporter n=1 Tax=Streptomyces polyasparticus TaxID=2767826 RepID=A0ABR7SE34_9ACTN|nr:DMT family transporter [Streptomyces polyasparticus]MBC9713765.1 DMT family transporter [Streptomyces polyasparticus]